MPAGRSVKKPPASAPGERRQPNAASNDDVREVADERAPIEASDGAEQREALLVLGDESSQYGAAADAGCRLDELPLPCAVLRCRMAGKAASLVPRRMWIVREERTVSPVNVDERRSWEGRLVLRRMVLPPSLLRSEVGREEAAIKGRASASLVSDC